MKCIFSSLLAVTLLVSCIGQGKKSDSKASGAIATVSSSEKIIIDTDSAFFNDDLAAITTLLRSPVKDSVLGITVTAGNLWPQQGATNIAYLLKILSREDIPVKIGESSPIIQHQKRITEIKNREKTLASEKRQWHLGWLGALATSPPQKADLKVPWGEPIASIPSPTEGAVDFIIRSVQENEGQLSILALGPLTNIAAALKKSPEIATKIKRIIFMGGAVFVAPKTTPYAEFNIWFDPEAAKEVLDSKIPEKVMFGEEVTSKVRLKKEHFDQIIAVKTPVTRLYEEDLGNNWPAFHQNPQAETGFWDTIPAVALTNPEIITDFTQLYINVVTDFGVYQGAMLGFHLDRQPKNNAQIVKVITDFDFNEFFKFYKERLTMQ